MVRSIDEESPEVVDESSQGSSGIGSESSASEAQDWKERNIGWMGSYYIMIVSHVLGVALKNQLFDYTSVVLAKDISSIGNGTLFSLNIIVSFFAGTIVSQLGVKGSQVLGHVLMLVFVALLSVCVFVGRESWWQWPFYMSGVVVAAFAQPVENTMMGPLVERTSQVLVAESEDTVVEKRLSLTSFRASLMATFTVVVALLHIIIHSATGTALALLEKAHDEDFAIKVMFPCLSIILLLALAVMVFAREPPSADGKGGEKKSLKQETRNMCRLWRDPRIWLLAFAPLCLGLDHAWKVVVLSKAAKEHLGMSAIAYLNLILSCAQIVLPKPVGYLMPKTGAAMWVALASLNYMLMPVLFWTQPSLTEGWGIATYYVMMGIGACLYNVVARSVVLEHFPKEQSICAFATMNVQMFSTSAAIYFLGRTRSPAELAGGMFAAGACMFPGYMVAERMRKSIAEKGEE